MWTEKKTAPGIEGIYGVRAAEARVAILKEKKREESGREREAKRKRLEAVREEERQLELELTSLDNGGSSKDKPFARRTTRLDPSHDMDDDDFFDEYTT